MNNKIAILGSGGWGTALAVHLARGSHPVTLWSARPESAKLLAEHRENRAQLPGVILPPTLALTTDPDEAIHQAYFWVVALPTAFLREHLQRFAPPTSPCTIVSLTKGIEQKTFLRPSQVIQELWGISETVVLSGPSHAEEVATGKPTSLVAASSTLEQALAVQRSFSSDRFRIYTNTDVIGVELAGALKNVMAIAAGICEGLGFGDNAKAALLTRGLVEMSRYSCAFGAELNTFSGLAGLGDLMATCYSRHGRNRRVGLQLAAGQKREDLIQGPQVAEGIYTAQSVVGKASAHHLDIPIMTGVYRILYEEASPHHVVEQLLERPLKQEQ